MPLLLAPLNEEVKIVKLIINDVKVKKHLENLGITLNSTITVIQKSSNSVIILVKDGRLALDKDTASHIFVA